MVDVGGPGLTSRTEDNAFIYYTKAGFGTVTVSKTAFAIEDPNYLLTSFSVGTPPVWAGVNNLYCHGNPPGYDAFVLANFPVGYWKMNEGTGTSLIDSSGGGTTGALINAPTFVSPGAIHTPGNTGLNLNGVNQYAVIGDPTSGIFDFGSGDFSAEFWVYRRTGCGGTGKSNSGIAKWKNGQNSPGTNEWVIGFCNGTGLIDKIIFRIESGTTIYSVAQSATMSLNTWYHIVGVREGTNLKLYLNGALDTTTAIGNVSVNNVGDPLRIGISEDAVTHYLNGIIDEVAIYPNALSPSQVAAHYSAGLK